MGRPRLRTKSVRTPADAGDGLRVLATRFRGRGLDSSRYDVWMPSLAPSEWLLRSFQTGRLTWTEFAREYRHELLLDGAIDQRNSTIRNHGQKFTLRLLKAIAATETVTLMCHCPEAERQCHRHLLRALISRSRI